MAGEKHVGFRNSRLTNFLRVSLTGNSKTTLVCTASKQMIHLPESTSTLEFAQRAKTIKTKAVANTIRSPDEMAKLIKKLESEVESLTLQLRVAGAKPSMNPSLT